MSVVSEALRNASKSNSGARLTILVCCAVLGISCSGKVEETSKKIESEEVQDAVKPSTTLSKFDSLLTEIPSIDFPRKFRGNGSLNSDVEAKYPVNSLHLDGYNEEWQIAGKFLLNEHFPLVLLKRYDSTMNMYDSYSLVSFDSAGHYISSLSVKHNSDGEGRTFAITPEHKIRVAIYGASEAIIRTFEYVNGEFIALEGMENADADNLPDY
jgi:hypothetical protein